MMTDRHDVPSLAGERVRLEPLRSEYIDELVRAANEDRSTYGFTVVPHGFEAMTAYVEALLQDFEDGLVVPFVLIDVSTTRVVGMTRYLTIRSRPGHAEPYAVEIGGTWLASSAQRTGINTEAKFLLMRFAFETWHVARVDFKTDARNERSRMAMMRIGASFEGVLRRWQSSQVVGEQTRYRDTAMFSIVEEEWPAISLHLTAFMK
jgi:RimJ/RimL family protein N-acetyltransferase